MQKLVTVLIGLIFMSGCASHAQYDYGEAISTVRTHNAVVATPQISNHSGQFAHANNYRHTQPVYRSSPYFQVNNTYDAVGFIFLMVFCVVLNDGDC